MIAASPQMAESFFAYPVMLPTPSGQVIHADQAAFFL
jgi:hypothetical protein